MHGEKILKKKMKIKSRNVVFVAIINKKLPYVTGMIN